MVARKDQPGSADNSAGASSTSDNSSIKDTKETGSSLNPSKKQGKKDKDAEASDLSEEDEQLKGELEMLVERLSEPNTSLYAPSLEALRSLIRTSTSSMTSVPKPLKFLRPHYGRLRRQHASWAPGPDRKALADILSVLAMTYSAEDEEKKKKKLEEEDLKKRSGEEGEEEAEEEAGRTGEKGKVTRVKRGTEAKERKKASVETFTLGKDKDQDVIMGDQGVTKEEGQEDEEIGPVIRESLRYRFLGTQEDPGSWGHEYVRHLASEIGQQYAILIEEEEEGREGEGEQDDKVKEGQDTKMHVDREGDEYSTDKLLELALILVPYFLRHNAEPEAVDLLLELEAIDQIVPHVDKDNFERVCLYILGCVHYLPYPEDTECLRTAHRIYRAHDRYFDAMKISIRLDYPKMIREDWDACKDR